MKDEMLIDKLLIFFGSSAIGPRRVSRDCGFDLDIAVFKGVFVFAK
jgi:hypothetical protein